MPTKVRIPTPLRKLTNNEEVVEVTAKKIGEAIADLQSHNSSRKRCGSSTASATICAPGW